MKKYRQTLALKEGRLRNAFVEMTPEREEVKKMHDNFKNVSGFFRKTPPVTIIIEGVNRKKANRSEIAEKSKKAENAIAQNQEVINEIKKRLLNAVTKDLPRIEKEIIARNGKLTNWDKVLLEKTRATAERANKFITIAEESNLKAKKIIEKEKL